MAAHPFLEDGEERTGVTGWLQREVGAIPGSVLPLLDHDTPLMFPV